MFTLCSHGQDLGRSLEARLARESALHLVWAEQGREAPGAVVRHDGGIGYENAGVDARRENAAGIAARAATMPEVRPNERTRFLRSARTAECAVGGHAVSCLNFPPRVSKSGQDRNPYAKGSIEAALPHPPRGV
jgi:hypothetical protein